MKMVILANNELLTTAVQEDYGSFRFAKAKEDVSKIGVKLNKQKKIDGVNKKVHAIGNKIVFAQAAELLRDEKSNL